MQNILQNTSTGERQTNAWMFLLLLAGYVILALFVFTIVAQILLLPFYDFDISALTSLMINPMSVEGSRVPLIITQGVVSIGAFIIVPIFFTKHHLKTNTAAFFEFNPTLYRPLFITAFIVLTFMVINSVLIEWNREMTFPEAFSWFESWAQAKEAQLEEMTIYLTDFDNHTEFLIAFVVIAIIPGIGEELLFRGLIQNLFKSATGNIHIAIWVSAIIFSAFHMQFYGFVPRMLLGALFGYLYYWSGHLSIAMFAHFLNNGFTITMLYLSKQEIVDYNPMTDTTTPPTSTVLLFTAICAGLLFLYWNYFKRLQNE